MNVGFNVRMTHICDIPPERVLFTTPESGSPSIIWCAVSCAFDERGVHVFTEDPLFRLFLSCGKVDQCSTMGYDGLKSYTIWMALFSSLVIRRGFVMNVWILTGSF